MNIPDQIRGRLEFAKRVAFDAGRLAGDHFQSIDKLEIEAKGLQDMVSNADLEVEAFVRERIVEAHPRDGIIGEEHEPVPSESGYTWVIDPIDGTANFVNAIPAWCVILACVWNDETVLGVIHEPCHNEQFWCAKGSGAFVNSQPIFVSSASALSQGSTGVGMNSRTPANMVVRFIDDLVGKNGLFYRNASGGLMLAYTAAGRLIGYAEPHMNAWDCLAGQLLIREAGGRTEQQGANQMLVGGGRVVASGPGVFDELVAMANAAFRL